MKRCRCKVVVVHKDSHKESSALYQLCAKSKKLKDFVDDVRSMYTHIAKEQEKIQEECTKISSKIPSTLSKDWWRDPDAIGRVALAFGLVICMSILSCSMKVGGLKDLSDRVDTASRKCESVESVINKLDAATKKVINANKAIDQFYDIGTNQLMKVQMMLNDLSNNVEIVRESTKTLQKPEVVNYGND